MKTTKRLLTLISIIGILLTLSSCGGENEYVDFLENGWDGNTEVAETTTVATTKASTTKVTKSNVTTTKASAAQTSTSGSKKYTSLEILGLYKAAANKVKTTNGITCTRTKEVITTVSGTIPGYYQSFGFKPGTNTKQEVYNMLESIKSNFCVEGKDYTCDLSNSDIKSASISKENGNAVITIIVKDDTTGTYDRSEKCVSTINLSDGSWTCKGVTLKGTLNANGQLIALYYCMPTYVTTGGDSFAFSIEQYWDITY